MTAVSYPVNLRLEHDQLLIIGEDGATITYWPLIEIHSVAKGKDGQQHRLRRGFKGTERLTLDRETDFKRLADKCPDIHHTTPRSFKYWKPALMWSAIAVVSVIILIKVVVPAMAKQIVNVIPQSVSESFGQATEEQFIRFFAFDGNKKPEEIVCSEKEGVAAINDLAQRLIAQMDTPVDAHITVINHSMINAFALPGGRVIVFNGLIKDARNSNGLAAVLAHELSHVSERHPMTIAFEAAGTSTLASLFFGDISGGFILGGLSQVLLDGVYQRKMERQADDMAITLLNRTGIDGIEFADFFLRLEKKYGNENGVMSYLSTHPKSKERSKKILAKITGKKHALPPQQWFAVREMCQ